MNHQKRGSDALAIDVAGGHLSSERAPISPSFSFAPIPPVSPDPAYIAAAAAANVVTSEVAHEFHIDLPEGASISSGSLHLINTFLDRLLFNFLSCARSTTLSALRTGVSEVLRPKIAKEAIAGADAELEEYLGGDVDELDSMDDQKAGVPWDLNVAWKRARLRCMLYTRLGDMEEDEEEMFLQQENLQDGLPGSEMQAAVAIFLTSILEYIGERALMIAAQAAYKRHETKASIESVRFPRVIVEEIDMEKNATHPALGRLWRSWRASLRSPRSSVSRISGIGPRTLRGFSASSRSSVNNESNTLEETDRVSSVAEEDVHNVDPAEIPLPITLYDIDEIEVPGYSAEYAQRSKKKFNQLRPQSMYAPAGIHVIDEDDQAIDAVQDHVNDDGNQMITPIPLYFQRPRASSLPLPPTPVFVHTHSPSDTLVSPSLKEVTKLNGLEDTPDPIIDMSGNSVAIIEDYAIPKANSAPVTPQQGYASSLVAGQTFYREDDLEHDPDATDDVLQFDRNDYEIGEHEHLSLGSRISTIEPTKNISGPFGSPVLPRKTLEPFESPIPVSPLLGPSGTHSGTVSPLEAEFSRPDVSPMNEDDIDYTSQKKKSSGKPTSPITPVSGATIAAITSPIMNPIITLPGTTERRANVADQVAPRANQGRQRSREGPTVQDYTKEEHREAYVIPQDPYRTEIPQDIPKSKDEPEKRKRQPAEKSVTKVVPNTLFSVRESFEMPQTKQPSAEPHSPTRQQPVSRKAVPATKPTSDVYQHRQMSSITTDGEQHNTSWPVVSSIPTKEPILSSRVSDTSSRVANTMKSSTGKVKGRVGSLSSPNRESTTSATSSDDRKSDRYSRSSTSDSQRDFDQLINSDETLFKTLTPQNMREIEENVPAALQIRSRFNTSDQNRIPQAPPHSPSPQSMNALRSNPPSEMPISNFVVHAGATMKRGPQLIPKDARTERTDTSDLKDFFRQTGPDSGVPNGVVANSGPRMGSKASKILGSENPQPKPLIISSSMLTQSNTTRNKPKFEPREAKVSGVREDTAMLAEFLRQGPPGFEDVNTRLREAPSVASTQDSIITRSVQSSTNSRVELLKSTKAGNNASKSQWGERMGQASDEQIGPVRKQRRVLDPYAIDTDSEDDDDAHTPTAGQGQDNEESLLDFLRNAVPPAEMHSAAPPPVVFPSRMKDNFKKPGGSIKSKFGSTSKKTTANTVRTVSSPIITSQSYQPGVSKSGNVYPGISSKPNNNPRQPIVNTNNQVYRTENLNGPVPRMTGNGVRQARKMARDSREDSTSIRELADFLRNTAPPPTIPTQPPLPPIPVREEGGGFTRMFSRRKKSVIA